MSGTVKYALIYIEPMNVLDFNDRGQAYVSEEEFMDYLSKTAKRGDYTKVVQRECQVEEKDWRWCECLVYYNSAGCMLASYNRDYNYGEVF